MVDNSNMPHPKCLGSQKNPGTEPKTCEKGPKLGFEYLPTSKTSHCVRTAFALRAWHSLSAPPKSSLLGHGSKKMPGAHPVRFPQQAPKTGAAACFNRCCVLGRKIINIASLHSYHKHFKEKTTCTQMHACAYTKHTGDL